MTPLSRAAVLQHEDRPPVPVDVPEWGGSVLLRPLSAADQQEVMRLARMHADDAAAAAAAHMRYLVLHTVVAPDGQPLFQEEDWANLQHKSAAALNRIVLAAMSVNKLGPDAVTDEAKNSSPGQSAGPSSVSPAS